MNKKGALTDEQLVILILAILGIVIIVVAVNVFMQRGNASMKETVCAFSTRVAANLHQWPISFPIACFEQEAKIKGDKFEVMKEIADLMARCWWMWGEGKIKEATAGVGQDVAHTCYYITTLEITDDEKIDRREFIKFLMSPGVFNRAGASSYWEYFRQEEENRFCFSENIKKEGFEEGITRDKLFYIGFIDDTTIFGGGRKDILVVNDDANIRKNIPTNENTCDEKLIST